MSIPVNHSTTAFVLVGGLGTRLQKVLQGTPKPLAPIGNHPFLDHLLRKLQIEGFTRVALLAGHKGEQFSPFLKRGKEFELEIELFIEDQPLGSAGALAYAAAHYPDFESATVINGDTWFTGALKKLRETKVDEKTPCALGLVHQQKADRYGLVELGSHDSIKAFHGKKTNSSGWINAGFMVIHKSILPKVPRNSFCSLETDIYPKLANIQGVKLEGTFIDIGIPEDYAQFAVDHIYSELNQKLPWGLPLISSWLHHGFIVTNETQLQSYFQKCGFDNVTVAPELSAGTVRGLSERDLCVSKFPSAEKAAEISKNTCAGLFWVDGPSGLPKGLGDVMITNQDLEVGQPILRETLKHLAELRWYYSKTTQTPRPALFMDRDGTIIEFIDYLDQPDAVKLKPEAVEVIRAAHKKNWAVVCVTNQSGIGRSKYEWNAYLSVQKKMLSLLAEAGVYLDACMEAPYFSDSISAKWHAHPSLRKPRSGMLMSAARRWGYDVSRSIMVGDALVDMQAGTTAGVSQVVYVGEKQDDLKAYQEWLKHYPAPHPKLTQDASMKTLLTLIG